MQLATAAEKPKAVQLPMFRGRQPSGAKIKVLSYEEGISDSFDYEDVVVIETASVLKVNHEQTAGGLEIVHVIKPTDAFVIRPSELPEVAKLLDKLRSRRRQQQEEFANLNPMLDDDDQPKEDAKPADPEKKTRKSNARKSTSRGGLKAVDGGAAGDDPDVTTD